MLYLCFKLLYATFLNCYFDTNSINECGNMNNFSPIYTLYDCGQCTVESEKALEKFIWHDEIQCLKENK